MRKNRRSGLALSLLSASLMVHPLLADEPVASKAKAAPLPLKTTRTVEFDTNEGTWISLDVSPSGSNLIFELMGDLYTLPIAGGKAVPVLTGNAFDSQPRYSPDGTRIVFVSDRDGADNLWTAKPDGSDLRQVTHEKHEGFVSPEWTPDGRFILVARSSDVFGGRELWLYDVHGGSGLQLTKASPDGQKLPSADQMNVSSPVASPDGRYIYYSRRKGLLGYDMKFPIWQVVRRDRQTGDEDTITQEQGSAIRPRISPDGKTLVYGTRIDAKTGLRVRDLATGDEHWLQFPVDRDDQESLGTRDVLPNYAFMPDGKSVVLSYGGRIHRVDISGKSESEIPFEAHVSQALGPLLNFPGRVETGPVVNRIAQEPKPSPDGSAIAFSAFAHIYVARGTAAPTRLTSDNTPAFEPTWSPDGKWISYVTWDSTGGALWKVAAEGGAAPQRLTTVPGYFSAPVWTPDGSRIVALRSSVKARDTHAVEYSFGQKEPDLPETSIVSVSAAKADDVTEIGPTRGRFSPQFTQDGTRIYFSSGKGLLSSRLDGSDTRSLVKIEGKNVQGAHDTLPAAQIAVSPDGSNALALVNHQAYLVPIPAVGGPAPVVNVYEPTLGVKRLSINGADTLGWSADGKQVYWALGATFFRAPLESIHFDAAKTGDGKDEVKSTRPDVKPETISLKVEQPRATPHGVLVLRGAKVITMHGDEVIENADLVIRDNRIEAVGAHGKVQMPAGAKVMDMKGATIMPGIIDIHAHWTQIRRNVLDLDNWPLIATLAYGVTSGRDPQTFSNDIFAYQDLIDAGQMIGPRAYSTGLGVFAETNIQSLDDARDTLTRYRDYYRTNLIKSYMVGNRQQRQWVVQASNELKMMPTTEGGIDTRLDLTHALDGFSGNEHNMPQVPLYKDVVEIYAKSGITYTPTLIVSYGGQFGLDEFLTDDSIHDDKKLENFIPHGVLDSITNRHAWLRKNEYVYPQVAAQAAKIVRAGGRVGVGGHGMMQGLQCHWEMWALTEGGMTSLEAIRSGTLSGAEAIGLAQDLGSLESGKLADLIILNKDPMVDIHNTNSIRMVMKNGELYDGDTMNQVWPVAKPLPEMWWQKENAERDAAAKRP